ncbi:Qat anti-phage system QueC-like protein QatC [Nonomuraea sp. NPDC052129]|uniref:Qat anti-phage system QueC-like protein QatC n=1 Tax=Nonomuraea sp. NPDC052129 TaxID=3154651 RepID=UPI00342B20DB
MAEFDLRFKIPGTITKEAAERTFYWPTHGTGTFNTQLRPRLGKLGPVPLANVELFRLAAMVYAADRSVPRQVGQVNWTRRTFALTVPVHDPDPWNATARDLEALLSFLSGDSWQLAFRHARIPRESIAENPCPNARRVVLMSGGADSAIGAFLARTQPKEHVLVSHVGATSISPIQKDIAERIRTIRPNGSVQHHRQVVFTRRKSQPGGYDLRNENSTRTRSFLFLALGLALASINEVELWIPENGFASLNPPLGPDQLGSLSTRTTHPWFLAELARIAHQAGAWADITNPFTAQTKGEMFRWLADEIGDETASAVLSATNSCAFTNRRWLGVKATDHCGTCFGCLVRRASFTAARLIDESAYVVDSPPSESVKEHLEKASILPSIRGFVARGIRVSDIAAMRLPAGYGASQARDLCVRGARELGLLV